MAAARSSGVFFWARPGVLQAWWFPVSCFFLAGSLGFGSIGLYLGLFVAPPDYQQGEMVRIMYVHVPSAYLATGIYAGMAVAAFSALVWSMPLAEVFVRASAPIGLVFTGLCLATGSIWAKPTWGTWWVWDARLTSVLVLFFLYLGYVLLVRSFERAGHRARPALLLVLVGAVNLPIVKFSVDWWHSLHQPASLLRRGGPSISPELLTPLLYMFGAASCFYIAVLLPGMVAELYELRYKTLVRSLSRRADL